MKLLSDILGASAVAVLGVMVVIALFLVGPVLLLWSVNSLAEAAGASFYIEHTWWNWWVAFIFLLCVRGAAITSK